ncbi:MAG: sporulation initiation factor Spo0A C-terminal domain-containing protein [Fusicatenibacter sp.]|nr:sporulation initiation factor Spo0A C-terminal domain-containing protein [Lachnospiraceae bacterium]MDY2938403.1 sporulation initiation factor Spo0A C-terminal domain-containing protein [Fusicatenibacter sp.]
MKSNGEDNLSEFNNFYDFNGNGHSPLFVVKIENLQNGLTVSRIYDDVIQEVLIHMGIPSNTVGYSYLVKALQLISENQEYLNQGTGYLYCDIAKSCNSTSACVERNIRHAIEAAFKCGNTDFIHDILGEKIDITKGIPTNTQFLSGVFYYIRSIKSH